MTHNASMLFGTTIPKKITSSYSHRDDVELAQGQELAMATLKFQNINGTVAS